LRWDDVDLAEGVIRVERGWDKLEGAQEPKTRSSRRTVPLIPTLRDELLEHRMRQGRNGRGLTFGKSEASPFMHTALLARVKRVWKDSGIGYVKLHEARHTFASLLIADRRGPEADPGLPRPQLDYGHVRPMRAPVPGETSESRPRGWMPI
jgi:integrase